MGLTEDKWLLFFCTAHFAQFEHRWTCSDVNAIGINNSVRYALDLQSNFYVLPALSASSPLFDLASSHDWWLKLWVHNTRHGQLGFWFIRQTKAVSFHGVRHIDNLSVSPPRDSTLGFFGGHLWLFTSHIVLLVSGCGPAKRHVHRAPFIKERWELFVRICLWLMAVCLPLAAV